MSDTNEIIKHIEEAEQLNKKHPEHLKEICEDIVQNYKKTLVSLVNDREGTLAKIRADAMQFQIDYGKQKPNYSEIAEIYQKLSENRFKTVRGLFSQEPKKPTKYCRFGHEIVVSTCKFHHSELKPLPLFHLNLEKLKKEKLLYEMKNPKHWLIKQYTRFFWLDYRERING